ncbi:MAG: CDP-glucose 4,6-dehydratase [Pseudobutyrivibrio sp.]|nr:CDP-glucose 4,6-dehydratase [Pseudobutyrivibrio sp.]
MYDLSFYRDKNILITGHTGFKGSWMCKALVMAGAKVTGYALEAPTKPSLFEMAGLADKINHVIGDVRDLSHLNQVFDEIEPEIVIHMAAQPIVRESYINPVYTYETNVMGTVNILECVRTHSCVRSFINVTTDKVYLNREQEDRGYREDEELNGYDPYSNSKSCSELVTSSYFKSFLANESDCAITTCRAGNVIGGGDFAADRIIPDCVRAAANKQDIIVRNPYSTRPYQHVLEPVMTYLMIAKAQYNDRSLQGSYNIGPDDEDCWNTGDITTAFCDKWNKMRGENICWVNKNDGGPHEARFLKLDCTKVKKTFGWQPVWNVDTALDKIVEWYSGYVDGADIVEIMENQIREICL